MIKISITDSLDDLLKDDVFLDLVKLKKDKVTL